MAMLGNLHSGNIEVRLPLDKSLINHGMVDVQEGANARIRWAIQDGKIDFKRSHVDIEGVSAAGIFKVRGAYLDDSGKLKLDMVGPDINITESVIGKSRMPRQMDQFAQAITEKYLSKSETPATPRSEATQRLLDGLTFSAQNVSLRPDRAIALGEGNAIRVAPNTKLDVAGSLDRVSLSGRAGIQGVHLTSGATGVALGKGDVEIQATAQRTPQGGMDARLQLRNLNLDVHQIHHALADQQGVNLEQAHVRNGSLEAHVKLDAQGNPHIPYLRTQGEFSAESLRYNDGARVLDSGRVQLNLDAQSSLNEQGVSLGNVAIQNMRGEVRKLDVTDSQGKTIHLEQAHVEGANLYRTRQTDGSFDHHGGIQRFAGTVEGSMGFEGAGVRGATSVERTTAEGNLQFKEGRLTGEVRVSEGTGRTSTVLDRTHLDLGVAGNITLAAGTRADFALSSLALGKTLPEGQLQAGGQLKGRIEQGHLQLAGTGRVDLNNADIDLNLKQVEKRAGETMPRLQGDLKLTLDSQINVEPAMLRKAGVTSMTDARGKVALELQGASLQGDGKLSVQRTGLDLQASVGEIRGQIQIPALASANTPVSGPNTTTSVSTVSSPAVSLQPTMTQPLSFQPLEVVGRVKQGTVELEIPLHEAGIEKASTVWGVQTLDLQNDTTIRAKLVVNNGQIDFAKSSFQFNKDPSALGLIDVHPHVTADGQIKVKAAGMDLNITDWITGQDRLPANMSDLGKQLTTLAGGSSTASSSTSIDAALAQGRNYAELGNIQLKAEGVALSSGRLSIGDNDYIELGEGNRINLHGTSREMRVQGSVDARDAYVDLGGTVLDLGQGKVNFNASIQTGLSQQGQWNQPAQVQVRLEVPEAHVDRFHLTQPDGKQVELRDGTLQGAVVDMNHRFERTADGQIKRIEQGSQTTMSINGFAGELRNTSLGLQNADDTQATLDVVSAQSQGKFSLAADGRMVLDASFDQLNARLSDLAVSTGVANVQGLDGSLRGGGKLHLDSQRGIRIDGDFTADARIDDGKLALNGLTEVDLARNSRAVVHLTHLDTTQPKPSLEGEIHIDAALDKGRVSLPSGQTLRFESGSKLQMSSRLGQDREGHVAEMTGTIYADLERQAFHHQSGGTEVSGELYDGVARIDLGQITVHEDGRYRIRNPNVKIQTDLNLLGKQN